MFKLKDVDVVDVNSVGTIEITRGGYCLPQVRLRHPALLILSKKATMFFFESIVR